MVGEASACRLTALSRHRSRNPLLRGPGSPAQKRRAGAWIFVFSRAIRSYRMNVTMCITVRYHVVVEKASVCRELAESRNCNRNPLLPRLSCAAQTWSLGEAESLAVSVQSGQSTNGRLTHHQVVSGGDINGLTHAAQPRRRAQKPRCELRSDRFPRVRRYAPERLNGHSAG